MPRHTQTQLERIDFRQAGWTKVMARNMEILNDALLYAEELMDVDRTFELQDGDVIRWNGYIQKFQNIPGFYYFPATTTSSTTTTTTTGSTVSTTTSTTVSTTTGSTTTSTTASTTSSTTTTSSTVTTTTAAALPTSDYRWNTDDKNALVNIYSSDEKSVNMTSGLTQACVRSRGHFNGGKVYFEIVLNAARVANNYTWGLADINHSLSNRIGEDSGAVGVGLWSGGRIYYDGTFTSFGNTYTDEDDYAMLAFDLDTGKCYFGKNGTWEGTADPATGTDPHLTEAELIGADMYIAAALYDYRYHDCSVRTHSSEMEGTVPSGFVCPDDYVLPVTTTTTTSTTTTTTTTTTGSTTTTSTVTTTTGSTVSTTTTTIDPANLAWDPVASHSQIVLSNDDKTASASNDGTARNAISKVTKNGGKWYVEITIDSTPNFNSWGIRDVDNSNDATRIGWGESWGLYDYNTTTRLYHDGSYENVSEDHPAVGKVVQIAMDLDNGYLWIGIDGNWLGSTGNPSAGTDPSFTDASLIGINVGISFTPRYSSSQATIRMTASEMTLTIPTGFTPMGEPGPATTTTTTTV